MTAGIILFIAQAVAAAICPDPPIGKGACTARPEYQKRIIEMIEKGVAARNEYIIWKDEEERLRVLAKQSMDPRILEGWHKAEALMRKNEHDTNRFLTGAIHTARIYYRIGPEMLDDGGSALARQGPMMGSYISWNPQFLNLPDKISERKSYYNFHGADGRQHFEGNTYRDNVGTTLGSGRVLIFPDIFKEALKDNNPGVLAYIIDHEAYHFSEMVTRSEDTLQAVEIRAYQRSLDTANTFQLNPDWTARFISMKRQYKSEISKGLGRSQYLSPEEEADIEKKFREDWANRESIDKARRQLKIKVEASRQEQYLYRIGDIARRLCNGSSGVAQEELNELPAIADGYSFSRQYCVTGTADLDVPNCRESVFDSLCRATDPAQRPGIDQLRDTAGEYSRKRYLAMSRRFADNACANYNSVKQADLDLLPRFRPGPTHLFSCISAPSFDEPSCSEIIYGALCESAGHTPPLEYQLQSRVIEVMRRITAPVPVIAPRGAAFQLADIARKACSPPGAVGDADLRPLYSWFPNSLIDSGEEEEAGRNLSSCGKQIYQALLGFSISWRPGSTISAYWIMHAAGEIQRREASRPAPPSGDGDSSPDRDREKPYSGPCGNGGSSCLWPKR